MKISETADKYKGKIKELDLNPVLVTENGVSIADALLVKYV
ncbi:hypothetical protein ALO_03191 [Acetonema longum DSM 6540]|uniref:Uncharacterized protein n=1 Tax=Acetonema longum DSM 6540 TaxID=1009370 RepID=F7NF19_9FIRM|nr:hypothetical protein ALO_03191 [Acetonema longum DSM 6540]